jgi:hypothetical protein
VKVPTIGIRTLANYSIGLKDHEQGCTWCTDEIGGIWLKHCKKVVYMGHYRFL